MVEQTSSDPRQERRDAVLEGVAAELLEAVRSGDTEAILDGVTRALGMPRHATVRAPAQRPKVLIYRYVCPWCDPLGQINPGGEAGRGPDGGRCLDCHGSGAVRGEDLDPGVWPPGELRRVPRPPAVMRQPCVDCAYRPGSPEEEDEAAPDASVPFFCHHGMVRVGDAYEASAYVGTMPLGAMVCAGWWALATGEPLPVEDFRDPGGADRRGDAPEVP